MRGPALGANRLCSLPALAGVLQLNSSRQLKSEQWEYHIAEKPHMAQTESTFRAEFWAQSRPILVAWCVDLLRMLLLWVGIAAAHITQTLVLSRGWIPGIVHTLDVTEELIVAVSVVYFLLSSTVSFIWTSFRRTAREIG